MKNFTRFASYFADYVHAGRRVDDFGVSGSFFKESLTRAILKTHVFEISDDVKRLLAMTKTPKNNDMIKLPFNVIFLDVGFKKEEMEKLGVDIGYNEIVGIMVTESIIMRHPQELKEIIEDLSDVDLQRERKASAITEQEIEQLADLDKKLITNGKAEILTKEKIHEIIQQKGYKVGTALRITICSIHSPDEGREWFDEFTEDINIYDQYKGMNYKVKRIDNTDPYARKFCHLFVLNFLNFINSPEVKFVTVERDEKRNEKRMMKGKVPIPERKIIKLDGVLKRYVDELRNNPIWHYHYRFWVRGHFRTFRSPRYSEELIGKRRWIPPFVKGKGVLIEQSYLVDKHEEEVDSIAI